jgi:hypothetical protein
MYIALGTLTVFTLGAELCDGVLSYRNAPKLFCKIKLGNGTQATTHAVKDGANFKWGQELKFRRTNELEISIELYHKNFFIEPDCLGKGEILLVQAFQGQEMDTPCLLSWEDDEIGKVNVRVKWEPDEPGLYMPQNVHIEVPSSSSSGQMTNVQQLQNCRDGAVRSKSAREQAVLDRSATQAPEARREEEERCIVCMQAQKLVAFYRCGHICCCMRCAQRFVRNRCPVCRQSVADYIKVYRV